MSTKAKTAEPAHDPETGEVIEAPKTALAATDYDYGDDIGGGFENQTSEDVSIPFITILQPGSPEVQGEDAPAKAGMFRNSTTGEFLSGKHGLRFVPALTQHLLVEWIPKDPKTGGGGGYVGPHEIDSDLARKVRESQPLGTYKHPTNDNDLVETFYVYGAMVDEEGNGAPAVLGFSSTHISPYKAWMYRARSIVLALPDGRKQTNLPLFSHRYRITTELKSKGGNSWYVPKVDFDGENAAAARLRPSDDLYRIAKEVKEAISAGNARAAPETARPERVDAAPARDDSNPEKAPY